MKKLQILAAVWLLLSSVLLVAAQGEERISPKKPSSVGFSEAERELREFFDTYAEDLRTGRGEAIAGRYDSRGYYRMGSGGKTLVSFEDNRKRFVTNFAAQKAFAWKDISIEVLAADVAIVTALFDWQHGTAEPRRYSYSGVLTKRSGQWRIRLEDESPAPIKTAAPAPQ